MKARLLLPLLAAVPGCVAYTEDPTDLTTVAIETDARAGGHLTVDTAIGLALRQNPELRALEASARAAGAATLVPLQTQAEVRGGPETAGWMFDVPGLLQFGPRGGATAAAEARAAEAVQALATARWQTAVAVVEAFLVDAALAELTVPDTELDVDAFAAAGLASPVAAARLRAAQARAASERAELQRQREQNLAALRHLLGLPRGAELTCEPPATEYVAQPQASSDALLARPDLALAAMRFRTADAAFRQAVADQYPMLQIGPEVMFGGGPLEVMGMVRWPLLAHGEAAAARDRRDAARATLEDALLEAQSASTAAEHELAAAHATEVATATGVAASSRALASARAALQVEPNAFERFAEAAQMAMRETMDHRMATAALARATTRRAMAFGWPLTAPPAEETER
jgi:hypothetical protein